jgi:hypothetical protein
MAVHGRVKDQQAPGMGSGVQRARRTVQQERMLLMPKRIGWHELMLLLSLPPRSKSKLKHRKNGKKRKSFWRTRMTSSAQQLDFQMSSPVRASSRTNGLLGSETYFHDRCECKP